MTTNHGASSDVRGTLADVLPPEDRAISPSTGYTRDHWSAVADYLLRSADAYRSPSGSRIWFPGAPSRNGVEVDGLEGFARTFLLAAFRNAGAADPAGDQTLDRYLEGVIAGTRDVGGDPESWPVVLDRHQPHVEAASIALSLHLTRSHSWERLDHKAQDRVAAWLQGAITREPFHNNWHLFPATIAHFLEAVDRGSGQTRLVINRAQRLIDRWYRGSGWYSDGAGNAYDHYIGWALHFYPVLNAALRQDQVELDRLRERLTEFLATYARMFDRNGAPVYLGRSLTYRMATVTSIALGEYVGATPLRPGESRRLMSANLRYFLEHGSITDDGVLSLGYHGPHPATLQDYSGPGSPYWASKGFLALALPADHPVWAETESEVVAADDCIAPIGPAGLLIQQTAADGLVRVHNHGSDHLRPQDPDMGLPDPLYARFAYSTRSGPTVVGNVSDNDIQVEQRGIWSVRRRIHRTASGPNWVSSWHAPRFPAVEQGEQLVHEGPVLASSRIESVVACHGAWELRLHRLVGVPDGCTVRVSGWAIAARHPNELDEGVAADRAWVERATPEPLRTILITRRGASRAVVETAPAGTAFGPWAKVPALYATGADGEIVAACASLTSEDVDKLPDPPTLTVSGSAVAIAWSPDRTQRIDLDEIFAHIPLHET